MPQPRARHLALFGGLLVSVAGVALACAGGGDAPVVLADDIPVAHTPDGGWRGEMPPPVLAACTEPLAAGAPDLRGTWQAVSVTDADGNPLPDHPLARHIERIEQCGDRVVVTSEPVIHDMRADGTLERGVNDVAAANFAPIQVAAVFNGNSLDLYPFGYDPAKEPLVRRERVGDEVVWTYIGLRVVMRRIDDNV